MWPFLADEDTKLSEDDGWEFVTLADQVRSHDYHMTSGKITIFPPSAKVWNQDSWSG